MTARIDPFERIRVGMTGRYQIVVPVEQTVGHHAPGMPRVFGTPFMILAMEMAAGNAIWPHLPEGWVSVGVDVNIRHLAATPVGRTVVTTSKVIALDDKLVHFEVDAHDGVNRIGRGTHSRAPVEIARFLKRLG